MNRSDESGWFPAPGEAARPDPVKSAQAGLRPPLPRRFYKAAGIEQRAGLYVLTLDGKPARTPGKNILGLASRDAAEALAAEWQRQEHEINPARMPVTRLANAAIDLVAVNMAAVRAEVARYGESDLLCYFAEAPDALAARQREAWQPLLDWAETGLGAALLPGSEIVHRPQPEAALAAIRRAVEAEGDPLRLAALHTAVTITGSAVLGLSVLRGRLTAAEAFQLSEIDADFQRERWGEDEEASHRRAARLREIEAAGVCMGGGQAPC